MTEMTDQATVGLGGEAMDDAASVRAFCEVGHAVRAELAKVIVGQAEVIDDLLTAVLAGGHVLLLGAPGLAKTLVISTLARCLALDFRRIQFTPDLMPSDITGTELLREDPATGQRRFRFERGPIFSNVVLADEINRSPPKTQSALLEAMGERCVTALGAAYPLDEPFLVMATQNPLEHEGTYPLPEAQLDRFLFCLWVEYPGRSQELEIMKRGDESGAGDVRAVLSKPDLLAGQALARRLPVADHLVSYAARLVRATRPKGREAPAFVRDWLSYGAGPRASAHLLLAAKARALLRGRLFVSIDDIDAVALPVLRHRVVPAFATRGEGLGVDGTLIKLIQTVPADERLYAWPVAEEGVEVDDE